jgi:hypothetical protein
MGAQRASTPGIIKELLLNLCMYVDGAAIWWKGPNVKRKRALFEPEPQDVPPAKHIVAYERRFTEGGGCHFSAGSIVGGDLLNAPGETIWFKCEARQDWFLIPPGLTIVEENDDNDFGGC